MDTVNHGALPASGTMHQVSHRLQEELNAGQCSEERAELLKRVLRGLVLKEERAAGSAPGALAQHSTGLVPGGFVTETTTRSSGRADGFYFRSPPKLSWRAGGLGAPTAHLHPSPVLGGSWTAQIPVGGGVPMAAPASLPPPMVAVTTPTQQNYVTRRPSTAASAPGGTGLSAASAFDYIVHGKGSGRR